MLIVDARSDRIADSNKAASRITNINHNVLINKPFHSIFPEQQGTLKKFLVHVKKMSLSKSECFPLVLNDTKTLLLELFGTIVPGSESRHIAVLLMDVTERNRTLDVVKKSQFRMNRAEILGQIGNWESDLDTGETYWSNEIYRLFGLEAGNFRPGLKAVSKLIEPEDFLKIEKATLEARKTGKPFDIIYRVNQPDGEQKIIRSFGKVFKDEKTGAKKLTGTAHDITLVAMYESEIKEREQRLKLVHDIAVNISLGISPEDIIEKTVSLIHRIFPQYRTVYGILSRDKKYVAVKCRQPSDMSSIEGMEFDLAGAKAYLKALSRGQVVTENINENPITKPMAKSLTKCEVKAVLYTAMMQSNKLMGKLGLESPVIHEWTVHEQETMADVARYLSLAISNVQLVKDKVDSENRLIKIAEQLTHEQMEHSDKKIALGQILGHLEKEKEIYRQELLTNIENLLLPVVKRLRVSNNSVSQKDIDFLEKALDTITGKEVDEFSKNVMKLTARELDICQMITDGKSSKDISKSIHLSPLTVHKHRESIRRKLQLKNRSINLAAYLRIQERFRLST